ncbi:MAG: nucleotide-binding protein [Clostridiales bacterium]|nr:nucleotide-binding protein [Clostridiales bacterium]
MRACLCETAPRPRRQKLLYISQPRTAEIARKEFGIGDVLVEFFEESAKDVGCVFILLTKDDLCGETFRPRQNVTYEWGYFMGKPTA